MIRKNPKETARRTGPEKTDVPKPTNNNETTKKGLKVRKSSRKAKTKEDAADSKLNLRRWFKIYT